MTIQDFLPEKIKEKQIVISRFVPWNTDTDNVVPNDWESVFVIAGVRYKRNDEIVQFRIHQDRKRRICTGLAST